MILSIFHLLNNNYKHNRYSDITELHFEKVINNKTRKGKIIDYIEKKKPLVWCDRSQGYEIEHHVIRRVDIKDGFVLQIIDSLDAINYIRIKYNKQNE